jgi:hypothetical protein
MKAVQLIAIAAIAASITFSSCSVEKRRYRKGYNVKKDKKDDKVDAKASTTKTTTEPTKPAEPVVVNTPVKTTAPVVTTKVETPAPAYTGDKKINTEYNFKVVQGPRPDKKGKKKYPMNFH